MAWPDALSLLSSSERFQKRLECGIRCSSTHVDAVSTALGQPTEVRGSDWTPGYVTQRLFIFGILLGFFINHRVVTMGGACEAKVFADVQPTYPATYTDANTDYFDFHPRTKTRVINHYNPHAMIITAIQTTAYTTQLHSQSMIPVLKRVSSIPRLHQLVSRYSLRKIRDR
jgi:hypothetical protein